MRVLSAIFGVSVLFYPSRPTNIPFLPLLVEFCLFRTLFVQCLGPCLDRNFVTSVFVGHKGEGLSRFVTRPLFSLPPSGEKKGKRKEMEHMDGFDCHLCEKTRALRVLYGSLGLLPHQKAGRSIRDRMAFFLIS